MGRPQLTGAGKPSPQQLGHYDGAQMPIVTAASAEQSAGAALRGRMTFSTTKCSNLKNRQAGVGAGGEGIRGSFGTRKKLFPELVPAKMF